MKTIEAGVRITWPTSNRRTDRYAVLSIRDVTSGHTFIEVELSADAIAAILANGEGLGSGEFTDHPERLGRVLENERIVISNEMLHHRGRQTSPEMEELGKRSAEGWEGYNWYHNNYGWSLTVWRYVEQELANVRSEEA